MTGLPVMRIAVVADSSSQLMVQALKGEGVLRGVNFEIYEADYDQVDQELLNTTSGLYRFNPEFIIVLHSVHKLIKKFYGMESGGRSGFAEYQLDHLRDLSNAIGDHSKARIIYANLPHVDDSVFGNFGNKVSSSWTFQRRAYNYKLMQYAEQNGNFFVLDVEQIFAGMGTKDSFDPRLFITADLTISIEALPAVAKHACDIVQAVTGKFRKCLILDLDNTMWGGIIGDDGVENIEIGNLGNGKAFTQLQLWAKQLKERGIILAVCSKNTEHIAREPFEKHPDMVLRPEDIAVFVANWETKVDNIRHIQSVLNIGFDSMVFLDDNPFERNIVRDNIPGIVVPELPEDPADYVPYLRTQNLFETASFAEEDSSRTRQYQEEAGRMKLQVTFTNEGEYLSDLNMVATVKPFDKFSTPRVAQLSQRSNQFNLRTVRYTEEDIARISASPVHKGITFSLRDRFGDYGLIAVVILESKSDYLFIDTWFMSCRVLKRGVENFTLNALVEEARKMGFRKLVGEYIPTSKNGMVEEHYSGLGFTADNGVWVLDVDQYSSKTCYISTENRS